MLIRLLGGLLFHPFQALFGQEVLISKVGGDVVIFWLAPNVVLESAKAIDGPWGVVAEARSPYRVDPQGTDQFYRLRVVSAPPNLRDQDPPPLQEVLIAVREFQEADPDASFSFFNGHVDSFATTAKPTVMSRPSLSRPRKLFTASPRRR